jgi:hypothetical protein
MSDDAKLKSRIIELQQRMTSQENIINRQIRLIEWLWARIHSLEDELGLPNTILQNLRHFPDPTRDLRIKGLNSGKLKPEDAHDLKKRFFQEIANEQNKSPIRKSEG